jgi:putative component of toxin-antitoxin plasmid stabilization module
MDGTKNNIRSEGNPDLKRQIRFTYKWVLATKKMIARLKYIDQGRFGKMRSQRYMYISLGREYKIYFTGRAVVVYTFSPSTREAKAGGFLSSRPAWSTK